MADHDDTELGDPALAALGADTTRRVPDSLPIDPTLAAEAEGDARVPACPQMPGWMREHAARTAAAMAAGAAAAGRRDDVAELEARVGALRERVHGANPGPDAAARTAADVDGSGYGSAPREPDPAVLPDQLTPAVVAARADAAFARLEDELGRARAQERADSARADAAQLAAGAGRGPFSDDDAWLAEVREEYASGHGYGGIHDDDLFDENVDPAVLAARDLAEDHFSDPTEPVLIVDSADTDRAAENMTISPALTRGDPADAPRLVGIDDSDYNSPEPTDRNVGRETRGEDTPAHTWTELQASADAVAAEQGPKAAQEWFNAAVDAQDGSAVGLGAIEFEGGHAGRDTVAAPAAEAAAADEQRPADTAAAGDAVGSGWDATADAVAQARTAVATAATRQSGGGRRGGGAPDRLSYRVPDDAVARDAGPVWER